ncbi:MAG: DDE-type integrase/transposase/recombinase, partial [Acidobacteriota bacterium]
MPENDEVKRSHERWAHFRFSVVGHLLAAPPVRGELKAALEELAGQEWRHPMTGERVRYSVSTIERWYYKARNARTDPVGALTRRVREDYGTHRSVKESLRNAIHQQHHQHKSWSYRLHLDNLTAASEEHPEWRPMPSYDSFVRYLKAHGLLKQPRRGPSHRPPGAVAAEARFDRREVRSYESEYVNALWHLDFHSSSLRVLMPDGEWVYPHLLGILDDHSRLCCHAQWYVRETAENLVHGVSQAFQKRGLPRSLMTDNGSAMLAAETEQGLRRLGILHEKTLPYSPYQNGKQEAFWGPVEGRLLAMLEGCADLTLAKLNEATLAWLELEYNRSHHTEIGQR